MNLISRHCRAIGTGLMLAVALLLAPAACHKTPYVETVAQNLYLGLPTNMDGLTSIDVDRLRLRSSFSDIIKNMEQQSGAQSVMNALREKVGFDPWQDLHMVVVGMRGKMQPNKPGQNVILIVRGEFKDAPAKLDKLRQWLGEDFLVEPPPLKQTQHASGVVRYTLSGQSQLDPTQVHEMHFAFPTESMAVISASSAMVSETLDVIGGEIEGLQKDPTWLPLLRKPDLSSTVWGAGKLSPDTISQLSQVLAGGQGATGISHYFFDMQVTQDFAMHAGLICDSIEAASKLTQSLQQSYNGMKALLAGQLAAMAPQTAKLLDKVQFQNEMDTAKLFFNLTAEEEAALTREWKTLSEKAQASQLPLPGLAPGVAPMPALGAR